jgi:hypothetical protein
MKIQTSLFIATLLLSPLMASANELNLNNEVKINNYPQRGKTMSHVRTQYGNAMRIHASKGKYTKNWPPITRWNYSHFTVYFEKNLVLHTVIH